MKRIFILIIVAIAVGTSFVFAAPPTGKSLYSSRRADSPAMMHATTIVHDEVVVPLQGQVAPRQAPAISSDILQLPTAPKPSGTPQPAATDFLNVPSNPIIPPELDAASELPLAGIKPPLPAESPEAQVPREETLPPLRREPMPPMTTPEEDAEKNQELAIDDFNARLAKIQLEKHNINETLDLIEKIKSPAVKVKTLVDLAEYVSRDRNYRQEAEQLYALAVDGIDALTHNRPIVISRTTSMQSRRPEPVSPNPASPDVVKPIQEINPPILPAPSTFPNLPIPQVPPAETPQRSTLTLIEEAPKADDKIEAPKPPTLPSTTPQLNGLNLSPLPATPPTLPSTLPTEKEKVAVPKPIDDGLNPLPSPMLKASEGEAKPVPTRRPVPKRQIIIQDEQK